MHEGVKKLVDRIRECSVEPTLREQEKCKSGLNADIIADLVETFGDNAVACDVGEAQHRNLGIFLAETLSRYGKDWKDIDSFRKPICDIGDLNPEPGTTVAPGRAAEGKSILPVDFNDGSSLFVKLGGTLRFTPDEIDATVDASKFGSLLGRETPHVVHADYANLLMATTGLEGEQTYENIGYRAIPVQELAGAMVFEAATGFGDRNQGNVMFRDLTLAELDFDYRWRDQQRDGVDIDLFSTYGRPDGYGVFSTPVASLINDAKSSLDLVEERAPGIRRAVAERLIEFYVKEPQLVGAAPRLFDVSPASDNADERLDIIAKIFGFPPKRLKLEALSVRAATSIGAGQETSANVGARISAAADRLMVIPPKDYLKGPAPDR